MFKKTSERPSLLKILWTDYPSFIYTAIAVVAWLVVISWVPAWRKDGPIINPEVAPIALGFAGLISCVAIAVVAYRYFAIRSTYQTGVEIRGKISEIAFKRDRGKVKVSYFLNGKEYISQAMLHRNSQTIKLKKGERLVLVVNSSIPERAFIRDLYINA